VVQPVLFALQVALAALWRSWGIVPAAVVGHSMGETAAAHVAGALSLAAAVRVICRRSRLLDRLRGQGAMALVELSLAEAQARLADWPGVEVAASNGPRLTVLSGAAAAVAALVADLSAAGLFARLVPVAVASHSAQVDGILDELATTLGPLDSQAPRCTLWSTVSGRPVTRAAALEADYWCANLRRPVLLAPVVADLAAQGHRVFIEISPHPVLVPAVQETVGAAGLVLASMRRDGGERAGLLRAAGLLYSQGAALNWSAIQPAGRCVTLPSYPWQRERFWLDLPKRRAVPAGGHPLLGAAVPWPANPAIRAWAAELRLDDLAYLRDHRVGGMALVPAAAYVEMALAAARQIAGPGPVALADLRFEAPLFLGEEDGAAVQVVADGGRSIRIFGRPGGPEEAADAPWTELAGLDIVPAGPMPATVDLAAVTARCPDRLIPEADYRVLAERGIDFGPAFRCLGAGRRGMGEALVPLAADAVVTAAPAAYHLHPVILDFAFQCVASALPPDRRPDGMFLPVAIGRVELYAATVGGVAWGYARLAETPAGFIQGDALLLDRNGNPLVRVDGLRLRCIEPASLPPGAGADVLLSLTWHRLPDASLPATDAGPWIVAARQEADAEPLLASLARSGQRGIPLDPGADLDDMLARLKPAGIIHAVAPAGAAADPATAGEVLCSDFLRLVQTLAGLNEPPRLSVVTRHAQAIGDDAPAVVDPAQAMIWGMARVAANEHPELLLRLVDTDGPDASGNDDPTAADRLLASLLSDDDERQVIIRNGVRHGARLVRPDRANTPPAPGRIGGTHLITGGLGGLGLALARHLADQGACTLVLVGRRAPGAVALQALERIEASGTRVVVRQADVTDPVQLDGLLAEIRAGLPPLRGVYHAAAVLDDGLMLQQTADRLTPVIRTKARAAWLLHDRLAGEPLDRFVLFSSMSALFGMPAQAGYAAANAFLDGLARLRRARGLPALSINWGPWATTGLAANARTEGILDRLGLAAIDPALCLHAFDTLVARDVPQAGIASVDPVRLRAGLPLLGTSPLLASLLPASLAAGSDAGPAQGSDETDQLARAIRSADGGQAKAALVERYLQIRLARALGRPAEAVAVDQPLNRMGLDSLMALEMRGAVLRHLGMTISIIRLLRGPTLAELARELAEDVGGTAADEVTTTEPRTAEADSDNGEWETLCL
ncbi:SDR family NAD(P)-dependent oxidoreductase, partial [Azospirillum sp. B506]|uniref:SDR family NAD(P)-dependent oxidoreductase n=1 Tax=Azospirillum sp. B506 TaxID=137721 RepID=UPI0005B2AE36